MIDNNFNKLTYFLIIFSISWEQLLKIDLKRYTYIVENKIMYKGILKTSSIKKLVLQLD